MNDKAVVLAFLFSALEAQVAEHETISDAMSPEDWAHHVSVYEQCGMGAVEVCRELSCIVGDMLDKFDPERPFCDLLYTYCDEVAAALYKFMREHKFMPTSLYTLEI